MLFPVLRLYMINNAIKHSLFHADIAIVLCCLPSILGIPFGELTAVE